MNIYAECKSCKEDIRIRAGVPTRPELQMLKGDEFDVTCKHCGRTTTIHVNDTRAHSSKTAILIGVGLGILATILLWNFYGAIGTISFAIPLLVWGQQENAVKGYNSYMIRRK